MRRVKVRVLNEGYAEGEALVSKEPISFLGDVDPKTGKVINKDHELYGLSIKGKILIFPHSRGSTVGSYILYQMKLYNTTPAGIVNLESEEIVIVGCILADIPLADKPSENIINTVKSGTRVVLDCYKGVLVIHE